LILNPVRKTDTEYRQDQYRDLYNAFAPKVKAPIKSRKALVDMRNYFLRQCTQQDIQSDWLLADLYVTFELFQDIEQDAPTAYTIHRVFDDLAYNLKQIQNALHN
jgi:hypothetical protein